MPPVMMPPVMMQLTRHESIQTTQEFYVGRNAEAAAEVVWEAFNNQGSKATTRKRLRKANCSNEGQKQDCNSASNRG